MLVVEGRMKYQTRTFGWHWYKILEALDEQWLVDYQALASTEQGNNT